MFYRISNCRACGGIELVKVMDLGVQPLANDFAPTGGECAGYAPLEVLFCRTCLLAQLSCVVRPEIMYANYSYVTSESQTMQNHFTTLMRDIVDETAKMGALKAAGMKLLEIGSNAGTLLKRIKDGNDEVLGIEPAENLAKIANERGIKTICQLWGEPVGVELGATGYRADVVVARHVFAHVDNWKGFIHALEFVTHKDSLVIIEVPWVVDMFKMNSFDQIYHEHLSYVSIHAIDRLLEGTQFLLNDVKHYSIHGGAIALFLKRRGEKFSEIAPNQFGDETNLEDQWRNLEETKDLMVHELKPEVRRAISKGEKVCGFGASAKATVWCNAANFSSNDIAFICDSTPQKQGKLVPGTDIPIVPEELLMEADYCINFAWNFHEEIAEKHKAFTDRGGKWILPCP